MQKIIRLRNPGFSFDQNINSLAIVQFAFNQILLLMRGQRVWLYLRRPKGLMLGSGVRFFNISRIRWGNYLRLGVQVYVSGLGRRGVLLGDNVSIGAFSRLVVSTSLNQIGEGIEIGNNVGIGEYAYLGGAGGLRVGDGCIVGQYWSCHPENHNYDKLNMEIRHQGVNRKGIDVGKNCWIGSKVTILDGVTLGNGCVVAAGSVVTKSFPANCIIAGVPAKLIRYRNDEN